MLPNISHQWVGWVALSSAALFILTLLLIPVLVVLIPADYFVAPRRHQTPWRNRHPAIILSLIVVRNAVGLVFVFMGAIMLVTPGQGVLTILVGMTLMNYPGKYRAERWLITRHSVWHFVNWLREKANAHPLIHPGDELETGED